MILKVNVPILKEPRPKKKSSRKIMAILILLFIAILGVLFFRSSLSKISNITFEGNVFATEKEMLSVSGLQVGAPFFGTSSDKIEARLAEIPSIEKATVNKSFPGSITITIKEFSLVAYQLTSADTLKGFLANGTVIELKNGTMPIEKPILTGWKDNDPYLGKLCTVLAQISDSLTSDISEITPSPTLSYPDRIKIYTRSHFEVISAISLLPAKVEYMNMILEAQDPGTLTMLEADSYVPYNSDEGKGSGENDTTH
jgi:cell division protein FtsQ